MKYKKVNMNTYKAEVSASHWYYGYIVRDFIIELDDDEDECMKKALDEILKNDIDFKYISWERAEIKIDFVIDGMVFTKIITEED